MARKGQKAYCPECGSDRVLGWNEEDHNGNRFFMLECQEPYCGGYEIQPLSEDTTMLVSEILPEWF